jgi:hypothetical protein
MSPFGNERLMAASSSPGTSVSPHFSRRRRGKAAVLDAFADEALVLRTTGLAAPRTEVDVPPAEVYDGLSQCPVARILRERRSESWHVWTLQEESKTVIKVLALWKQAAPPTIDR